MSRANPTTARRTQATTSAGSPADGVSFTSGLRPRRNVTFTMTSPNGARPACAADAALGRAVELPASAPAPAGTWPVRRQASAPGQSAAPGRRRKHRADASPCETEASRSDVGHCRPRPRPVHRTRFDDHLHRAHWRLLDGSGRNDFGSIPDGVTHFDVTRSSRWRAWMHGAGRTRSFRRRWRACAAPGSRTRSRFCPRSRARPRA